MTRKLFVVAAVAALVLVAGVARATDYPVTASAVSTNGPDSHINGFHIAKASLASGSTVSSVFYVGDALVPTIKYADGTLVYTLAVSCYRAAAADSVQTQLSFGPTAAGPWTTVWTYGGSTRRLTSTQGYYAYSAAYTTIPPMPWCQAIFKNVHTSAAKAVDGYVWFIH